MSTPDPNADVEFSYCRQCGYTNGEHGPSCVVPRLEALERKVEDLADPREQAYPPRRPGLDPEFTVPCKSCGKPFKPDHDVNSPGPTVRHPFFPKHPFADPREGKGAQ